MASELASVVQSTHLNTDPSPEHDINPSTAASTKIPAVIESPDPDLLDSSSLASSDDIPSDVLRPLPRPSSTAQNRPGVGGSGRMPLPDLRFEQTYLVSIKNAATPWQIAYITIRDQVLSPLAQGVLYHLVISGWRYWNTGAKFAGQGVGARVRRWWWGVNGWKMPREARIREAVKEMNDPRRAGSWGFSNFFG